MKRTHLPLSTCSTSSICSPSIFWTSRFRLRSYQRGKFLSLVSGIFNQPTLNDMHLRSYVLLLLATVATVDAVPALPPDQPIDTLVEARDGGFGIPPYEMEFCDDKKFHGRCHRGKFELNRCHALPDSNAKGDKGSSFRFVSPPNIVTVCPILRTDLSSCRSMGMAKRVLIAPSSTAITARTGSGTTGTGSGRRLTRVIQRRRFDHFSAVPKRKETRWYSGMCEAECLRRRPVKTCSCPWPHPCRKRKISTVNRVGSTKTYSTTRWLLVSFK